MKYHKANVRYTCVMRTGRISIAHADDLFDIAACIIREGCTDFTIYSNRADCSVIVGGLDTIGCIQRYYNTIHTERYGYAT